MYFGKLWLYIKTYKVLKTLQEMEFKNTYKVSKTLKEIELGFAK